MRVLYVKVTSTARRSGKLYTPAVIKTEMRGLSYSNEDYDNPGLLVVQ